MSSASRLIVPALRGACVCARGEALSSSSVLARQSTGGHLFRIRPYSLVDRMVPTGTPVTSGEFNAAKHKWNLAYYPNGVLSNFPGTVHVFPSLSYGNRTKDVYAAYRVSILDSAGNPAYSLAVGPGKFSRFGGGSSKSKGGELVSTEELRSSMERLVDDEDCLNVRFDVNVLELSHSEEPHNNRTDDCTDEKETTESDSESDYSTSDDD